MVNALQNARTMRHVKVMAVVSAMMGLLATAQHHVHDRTVQVKIKQGPFSNAFRGRVGGAVTVAAMMFML
jgi:hypothetical protein